MERELDLLTSSPHERIQRVLKRSPQVFQEIPAKYIASYLRMTPETLSRILNSCFESTFIKSRCLTFAFMKQTELIADLKARTSELIKQAEAFKQLPAERLNQKSSSTSWSVLECLEHLNLYGDFYLPEIESCIIDGEKINQDPNFKSGWFGEKTVQDMLPKNERVLKESRC